MEQLQFSPQLISFITTNQTIQIITEYDLTDFFHLEREVEQGDAISPIL